MYEIRIKSEFAGAHNLRGYKGKCESLHGHNWKVEAILYSDSLNSQGMVMDFREFKSKLNRVLEGLDHKYMNSLPYFKKVNPTSENIACYIHKKLTPLLKKKLKISVWETDTSSASFE